jgi:hypothetical protein
MIIKKTTSTPILTKITCWQNQFTKTVLAKVNGVKLIIFINDLLIISKKFSFYCIIFKFSSFLFLFSKGKMSKRSGLRPDLLEVPIILYIASDFL